MKRNGVHTQSLLIITGTMGVGKTSVLGEASDILKTRDIPHAALDLDALGVAHLRSEATNDGVMYQNLRSICRNYESLGVSRLLLARALETRTELDLCRSLVSASDTVVCRLTAAIETMEQRIKARETGLLQREYVARVAKLNTLLDEARLEDFSIVNENRPLTAATFEMLVKAGWITS